MYCPKCGKQLKGEARFCGGCGAQVPARPLAASGKRGATTATPRSRALFGSKTRLTPTVASTVSPIVTPAAVPAATAPVATPASAAPTPAPTPTPAPAAASKKPFTIYDALMPCVAVLTFISMFLPFISVPFFKRFNELASLILSGDLLPINLNFWSLSNFFTQDLATYAGLLKGALAFVYIFSIAWVTVVILLLVGVLLLLINRQSKLLFAGFIVAALLAIAVIIMAAVLNGYLDAQLSGLPLISWLLPQDGRYISPGYGVICLLILSLTGMVLHFLRLQGAFLKRTP